ncbi:MAG: hypothetical protein ACTSP4_06200 [Candidatus Hodarchaeales archaeon]
MEIQDILNKNCIAVIDPFSNRDPKSFEVDSLMVEIAELAEEVALVVKAESGKVLYRSMAAPREPNFPDYFPSFVGLAKDLGLKVDAFVYAHGDSFMGAQRNYSVTQSGGLEQQEFVCPSQKSYWKYLSTVTREIARQPVDSIIFNELMYPRQEFCFCKRCRREFSETSNASFEITYRELESEPEYREKFIDWRAEMIGSTISEVFDAAKRTNPSVNTGLVFPLDPETDWVEGARSHHGLDLSYIADSTTNLILHIMPWSPIYPEPGTDTWRALVSMIQNVKRFNADFKFSIYVWGFETEFLGSLDWLEQLQKEVKAEKVYVRLDTPPFYNIKREIIRGLY